MAKIVRMPANDRDVLGDGIAVTAAVAEVACSRRAGRPTTFSAAVAEEIVERLENGEVLAQIAGDEHMPTRRTINRWIAQDAEFCQRYTRARTSQAAAVVERGYLAAWNDDGPQHVQRNRLRFDACRWLAARLDPRWSDSAELRLSVSDDPEADERRAQQRVQLVAALEMLAASPRHTDRAAEPELWAASG
jgi:hypothetical protein